MSARIVESAENSPVLSVRGTCFFVLGLIASTISGAEALQDYGWQSVCTPLGAPMGLCIPDNVNRLVSLPRWEVNKVANLSYLELAKPETLVVNKIITDRQSRQLDLGSKRIEVVEQAEDQA